MAVECLPGICKTPGLNLVPVPKPIEDSVGSIDKGPKELSWAGKTLCSDYESCSFLTVAQFRNSRESRTIWKKEISHGSPVSQQIRDAPEKCSVVAAANYVGVCISQLYLLDRTDVLYVSFLYPFLT